MAGMLNIRRRLSDCCCRAINFAAGYPVTGTVPDPMAWKKNIKTQLFLFLTVIYAISKKVLLTQNVGLRIGNSIQ